MSTNTLLSPIEQLNVPFDREGLEDIGFMTCMTLSLLGNYAQTGHFGGPLAYTPYNVAVHLAGPALGGLRYDIRRPKHPFSDKVHARGRALRSHLLRPVDDPVPGHGAQIQGHRRQALLRRSRGRHPAHRRPRIPPRRGPDENHPAGERAGGPPDLFAQAKARGIKALAGHAESIDVTNDVNGGPSGVGIATAAGKAAFWDIVGAPSSPKVIAFEGEFAMTEGHAQEIKTQALAMKVGKRLRIMLSDNNAGIDDILLGGVIAAKYDAYRLVDQWTSYGWNVFTVDDGNDYGQVVAALKTMEEWDPQDRRPMIVIGKTTKGYWPRAVDGKIPGHGVAGGRLPKPSLRA